MLDFERVQAGETEKIEALSALATAIVREHFDPIIGRAQNDYMLALFQTVPAITGQLEHGYRYYFVVEEDGARIGFVAFYPRGGELVLSKFYLKKEVRGRGYARHMLDFVLENARALGCGAVVLNVNRDNPSTRVYEALGFVRVREEKNDIGGGFCMDDYVYRYALGEGEQA